MSRQNTILVFVCVAAVAVRCWKIDAPFTDSWSWRQSDVAAIARNYFENGFHFARPQIDWAGISPALLAPNFRFCRSRPLLLIGFSEWKNGLDDCKRSWPLPCRCLSCSELFGAHL